MIFLLDTNAIIKILNNDRRVVKRLRQHPVNAIGISSVVMHELYFGAYKGRHTHKTLGYIDDLAFEIVSYDAEDARVSGEIRSILLAPGTPIGPYDLLIAGQALARDLTIVTHNTREFSRVPGLRVEDWEV